MNTAWWKSSTVYHIYPRSFLDTNGDGVGDLNGVTKKLDYLKRLGIDIIWLSPVYDSPNDDNGYDIRHYQRILSEFGTMADWENLLEEIHIRGMKLMMDLVVNHTSDEHTWFINSRSSKSSPYRDYYVWRPGRNGLPPNNWQATFGGSAWKYDKTTDEFYLHLFSEKQPDLNWENPRLRNEIYSMMQFWLDKGVDGFRMDVINFISKDTSFPDGELSDGDTYASGHPYFMNGPRIHEFLQEMNNKVLSDHDMVTVGEMPGVTSEEAILYTADDHHELNMVFHFEHMDIDAGEGGKWDVVPFSLIDLKNILSNWQTKLDGMGWNSLYWNNHDQPRVVSRFGNDAKYRVISAKMLATTLHMMKGTPYIYQGEEIGMTNADFTSITEYRDIETMNAYKGLLDKGWQKEKVMNAIQQKSRDNARTPMQWNAAEHSGFTTGQPWIRVNANYKEVNADAALNDPGSIFYHYQRLIQLRKTYQVIVDGTYELFLKENKHLFVYTRTLGNERILVASNFSENVVPLDLDLEIPLEPWRDARVLIGNYGEGRMLTTDFILQPFESIVFYLK